MYLVLMKCVHEFIKDEQIRNWMHADTTGFNSFPAELIHATNDTQLIILYAAYVNAVKCQCKDIKNKLSKLIVSNK